jgi:hypothetical protein
MGVSFEEAYTVFVGPLAATKRLEGLPF